jgi:uncharacterized protein (TIGR03067 family)
MQRRKPYLLLVLALAVGCHPRKPPERETTESEPKTHVKPDAELIQGDWEVVAVEAGGKATPAEKIKGQKLSIGADKVTFKQPQRGSGKERFVTFTLPYKIDAAKQPKWFDTEAVEETRPSADDGGMEETIGHPARKGIYVLEGDTLRICWAISEKRPTEFETTEGSKMQILVLKREKH